MDQPRADTHLAPAAFMNRAARILVADRDEASSSPTAEWLATEGYDVFVAGTGGEALALLTEKHADLVLVGPQLPDMTGGDLCRAIKSCASLERVFVVRWFRETHWSDSLDPESSGEADGYLEGSPDERRFHTQVRSFVQIQASQAQLREHADRLSAIVSTQQEIAAAPPDPDFIMKLAAARAQSLTKADGAAVELLDGDNLVARAVSGILDLTLGGRSNIAASISGLCVRMDEPTRCDDVDVNPPIDAAAYRAVAVRSLLIVPLRHQYNSVGALKVVSLRPQAFGEAETQCLQLVIQFMAAAVNQTIAFGAKQGLLAQHSRTIQAFRESEARFRNAFDHAAIGMALVAVDGRWMKANQTLCKIVGYSEGELRARTFQSLVHSDDLESYREHADRLDRSEAGNFQMEMRYLHKSGSVLWILLSASILRDGMGQPLYRIDQIQDITERKKAEEKVKASLREKDVLLKEIHHRVKNNLQVISSLLNLQSSYMSDQKTQEHFRESQNRVRSMALIHEKLYHSEDLARIGLDEYIVSLASILFRSYGTTPGGVKLETRIDPVFLSIDIAIPIGLLLNELISNSLKHAFPGRRSGTIFIDLSVRNGEEFVLAFRDDGVGFPPEIDLDKAPTLGLRLVKILTGQIGGELTFHRNGGAEYIITFREQKQTDKAYTHVEPSGPSR